MTKAERQVSIDLDNAERKVAEVLRDLEALHPSYCVTDLGINTIEVTNLDDRRPRFMRRIHISLAPNAQNEWMV